MKIKAMLDSLNESLYPQSVGLWELIIEQDTLIRYAIKLNKKRSQLEMDFCNRGNTVDILLTASFKSSVNMLYKTTAKVDIVSNPDFVESYLREVGMSPAMFDFVSVVQISGKSEFGAINLITDNGKVLTKAQKNLDSIRKEMQASAKELARL